MKIKCPCCGVRFGLEVTIKDNFYYNCYGETQHIVNSFFNWLKGREPRKGWFKKNDNNEFEFSQQIYDSPEGDIWATGIIEWIPGYSLDFKEVKFSE